MTEVEIDFGELLVVDLAPAELPDLWPGSPIELVGRSGVHQRSVRGRVDGAPVGLRHHLVTRDTPLGAS